MNILLLGSQGQVGSELARVLLPQGSLIALGREQADLADAESLRQTVRAHAPDLIVNAAAYTAVDKAESDEAQAMAVNAMAPGILAEEARRSGALLIHYSTDYVFDGRAVRPYRETDPVQPLNIYGRSKLGGEQAITGSGCDHLVLRTSWVYGAHGHNFLRTVLRLAHERQELRIVADQIGAPTWSRWIAEATADVARQAMAARAAQTFHSGIYHLACAGETSWRGFAQAIVAQYRDARPEDPLAVETITPIATADYPTPAQRPANSRLDCGKLQRAYGISAPDWQDALQQCITELG